MKKSDIILIGVVVLIVLIAFLTSIGKEKGEPMSREITYKEYQELINSGDPFVIVFERTGCGYCEKYMPIVEKVATKKNVSIVYIDIANLSDDERQALPDSNEYLSSNEWGTPTTLILKGTEDIDSISGYVEEQELEKFVEQYIALGETEENE